MAEGEGMRLPSWISERKKLIGKETSLSGETPESITEIKVDRAGPDDASLPSQLFGKTEEKDPQIKACRDYSEFKANLDKLRRPCLRRKKKL